MENMVIIENQHFVLKLDSNCVAQSLIHKETGEECLHQDEDMALFSLTEERPFNNEIKLAYPTKKTTYQANRVRREGNKLIVGFEIVLFEAVVEVIEQPDYIAFRLEEFLVAPKTFGGLALDVPPVVAFRLLQLPVKNRKNFGEWLNVSWDDKVAVNVLATSPCEQVDAERRKNYRVMYADAYEELQREGSTAVLVVSAPDKLMDCVEKVEEDFKLPQGVKSRRSPEINRSIYWVEDITPQNVDEHIAYAQKGGFSMMMLYYTAIFKEDWYYIYNTNYDYRPEYPNGDADLRMVVQKIKAAGITPGFHFLHTFVGVRSRYVTPVADYRLNLKRHFTLDRPLAPEDTTVYVAENPKGCIHSEPCRILKFGGELIHYEDYSTEYPYCFTGCKRGHYDTYVNGPLPAGFIGGLLDVSSYKGAVHIEQKTTLQDEIAEKVAHIYNLGFEFAYYDGSEGTDAPFAYEVPHAQYLVYQKLNPAPLFCEGAAKSHFSWHMLSGGNAFDIFPTNKFKNAIAKHPLEEAGRMAQDFTRLNFGWWAYYNDTQPDIYEYGTSRAASWDCPVTMMASPRFKENARTADTLEVMRRWEDVRKKNWLTAQQKEMLKDARQEHTLLINEQGEYELVPYEQIPDVAGGDENLRAFVFQRCGKNYVVYWHTTGEGKVQLPLTDILVEDALGETCTDVVSVQGGCVIPASGKRYVSSSSSKEELVAAFQKAKLQ